MRMQKFSTFLVVNADVDNFGNFQGFSQAEGKSVETTCPTDESWAAMS